MRPFLIFSIIGVVAVYAGLDTGIFPSAGDLSMRKKDYWEMMAMLGMLSAYIFWSGFNR